jgi:hypothetical protein
LVGYSSKHLLQTELLQSLQVRQNLMSTSTVQVVAEAQVCQVVRLQVTAVELQVVAEVVLRTGMELI